MHRFDQDRQSRFQPVSRFDFPRSLKPLTKRVWRHFCAPIVGLTVSACLLAACQTTQVSSPPPQAKPADTATAPPPPPAAPVVPQQADVRVAILLPLTGKAASVGQSLLNAAQMALFDLADTHYTLLPFDTQGTAEGAAMAARQAIEQGAQMILGPLFSQSVTAVAQVAQPMQIPVISYSTNPDVATPGVYVSGFLLRDQARRLVEEAMGRGRVRFAMITPNTAFGQLMATAFSEAVMAKAPNVTLVAQESYDPNSTQDITAAAKRLLPGGDATPSFDVLMIAESGQKLHEVTALLAYAGLSPQAAQLVGPMLWNDPRVMAERSLDGGWFPAPPPATHDAFSRRYQSLFGEPAPSIAGLGYDTTALTIILGRQPLAAGQVTPYSVTALTNSSGFAGVDGVFRLRADGTTERGLAVMEINGGSAHQIGPAPTTFANPQQPVVN